MNLYQSAQTTQSAQSLSWLPGAVLQRKCGCGQHTGGGSCADCEKKKTLGLQAKLTMGNSDDVYEREADLVADRVLSSPTRGNVQPAALQIQRYAEGSGASAGSVPDSVGQTLSQSGMPLPRTVRQNMEQRFGHDFSQVRIHSGSSAANSARDVNAQAYTVGQNIVFGAGRFSPDTSQGQRLLAHELTHVVQQRGSVSPAMQRQPADDKEVEKDDFKKELEKDGILDKLEKAARDKIKKEIEDLPKTVTKLMIDKIIDLTVTDPEYNEALKKTAEGIIETLTRKGKPSTSICDIPGYHEGGSSDFKGQCCRGTIESAQDCCPKDKFAPNNLSPSSFCCAGNEFVNSQGQCEKSTPVKPAVCVPPDKPDAFGGCCKPPREVIGGLCMVPFKPPTPQPPPQPFTVKFRVGVIDDYTIDKAVLNSRQKPKYEELKNQMRGFLETCPGSIITITGFADKPGTEEHNLDLGQRRAEHIKFLLDVDFIDINSGGIRPWIFARSEGEGSPVDPDAGEKFSARNRRVEIEFNSICPPLSPPTLEPPLRPSWQLPPLTPGPF